MASQFSLRCLLMLATILVWLPEAALAEARFAYVDLQKALAESKAGQEAQKSYEAEVRKAQASIDQKKREFEDKQKAFEKQRESLNERAITDKQEELVAIERDLQRSFRDSQETLRRKNATLVGDLLVKMREAVAEVGKAQKFTVILEKGSQAVLYADNSIDITDDIVKKFNELTR